MKISKYYGQHGEDAVISSLFSDDYKGYFIEVGALEGIRFSNSYVFEKAGWEGVVIEAHPDYFELLKKNRNCSCVWAAAGDDDKSECIFYANFRGSLSTLNKTIDFSKYRKYWGKGKAKRIEGFSNGEISVPMAKLDTIIENNLPNSRDIDLISIDIDGSETIALKAFDIKRWLPRVIIFEISVVPNVIYAYMKDKGYHLARHIGCNVIYCRDLADSKIICNSKIDVPKATIEHPCGWS
jgi:FkbM family methyltransferase